MVLLDSNGVFLGKDPEIMVNGTIKLGNVVSMYTSKDTRILDLEGPPVHVPGGYRFENDGWVLIDEEALLEATAEPSKTIPQILTARQARLALHGIDKLTQVPVAVAALPEPQKTQAEIEWEYATHIERNNPFVAVLANALQLTDKQIDQLFVEGAKL